MKTDIELVKVQSIIIAYNKTSAITQTTYTQEKL